jgi:hypothetical protein
MLSAALCDMWGVVHGACLIWPCRTPTLFQIKVANQRADPVSRAFSLRQLGDCECLARIFTVSPKTGLLSAAPCLPTRVELHWSVGPVAVNLQRRSNPVPGCVCRPTCTRLKQAMCLGGRTAVVNWAWWIAGGRPSPSRFICTRCFEELGV